MSDWLTPLCSARIGRRKSWIIPVQLVTAGMLILCSGTIQKLYEAADVSALTSLFTVFVFMAATQVRQGEVQGGDRSGRNISLSLSSLGYRR